MADYYYYVRGRDDEKCGHQHPSLHGAIGCRQSTLKALWEGKMPVHLKIYLVTPEYDGKARVAAGDDPEEEWVLHQSEYLRE